MSTAKALTPNVSPATAPRPSASWQRVCSRQDLVPHSGVVVWFAGAQVALFHLPQGAAGEQVHAIHNRDPQSGANVIGRGLLGHVQGSLVVASPLYKQHFRLQDGTCIEQPEVTLKVWPARLNGDSVELYATGDGSAAN